LVAVDLGYKQAPSKMPNSEGKTMSDQIRKWPLVKSFQWAAMIGLVAGLVTAGVLSNHIVGNLELRESLLIGVGVGIFLTVVLTGVFDRVSNLTGRLARTVEAKAQQVRRKKPKKH
jgi:hypothetical protein